MAPQSVEISGRSNGEEVMVGDGTSLTLDCLVKDARPVPTAMWLKDGTPLPPGKCAAPVNQSGILQKLACKVMDCFKVSFTLTHKIIERWRCLSLVSMTLWEGIIL